MIIRLERDGVHTFNIKIVTLVGSTKHCRARLEEHGGLSPWQVVHLKELGKGYVVLTLGCETKSDEELGSTSEQLRVYEMVSKHHVQIADEIVVVNYDDYLGDHTREELQLARQMGKPIRYAFPHREVAS